LFEKLNLLIFGAFFPRQSFYLASCYNILCKQVLACIYAFLKKILTAFWRIKNI
jgi:hypothetical protein